MDKALSIEDIDEKIRNKVYSQDYGSKTTIEDVKIIDLVKHVGEEGDFAEIIRVDNNGEVEQIPGFKIAQINRTRLFAGSIKAWHLHFNQDELWYLVPTGHLIVGLWDVRKNSNTVNVTMRIPLGAGLSRLLYIPRGVAHGSVNITNEAVELFYFTNSKFDINNPDEKRINWDFLGKDFWMPEKD